MKNYGICAGLLALVGVAADGARGQEPPLIKPAGLGNPSTPGAVRPVPAAIQPLMFIGQPFPYAGLSGYANGPCLQCPQPIFRTSATLQQDIYATDAVANRAIALGNVGINTKKIADVLDRGFPNITPPGSPTDQARKKAADAKILLAGGDPKDAGKDPSPNAQDNGSRPEFKQTIDEISKIFKVQADLIRSIDVGGVNRQNVGAFGPNFNPNGVNRNGYCPNGNCGIEGCAIILTGRTGLELTMMAPQTLDVLNLPRTQGLYVKEVYAKTPADLAGYKRNDVLVELDGKKVPSNFADFLTQVFGHVKNDTPISGVVLRGGQRVEITGMKITDRRTVPLLPNECPLDAILPQIIQTVPGINSTQLNTNRVRELHSVSRPGGITEFIWVDVPEKR